MGTPRTDLVFFMERQADLLDQQGDDIAARVMREGVSGIKYLAADLAETVTKLAVLEADAQRYRWLRNGTMGDRHPSGKPYFLIIDPRPVGNIMQGSVAEHLDDAIDAALAAKSPLG